MNEHIKFKSLKKSLNLTNADIAKITGSTTDSIKSVTQPNKELPRWLKFAIYVFESKIN